MAKYGKTLAQVVVEINGKRQAEQVLKAMQSAAEELRKKVTQTKTELEELAKGGTSPEYTAKLKELQGMEKELKQLERSINETKKFSQDVGSILDNMSQNNTTVLNRTKRALESLLNSITPNTKKAQKQIEQLQKAIKQVTDEIARRKGQITEFDDIIGKLGKATPKQLDSVEKRLQSLLASVTENSNAWRKYKKQLETVQGEKAARKKSAMEAQMENVAKLSVDARNELKKYWQSVNDGAKQGSKAFRESLKNLQEINRVETEMAAKQAKKVLAKPKSYSVGEINDAIKVAEQMQLDTKDKKEWADLAAQIAEAKKVRDSFADSAKLKVMSDQFKQVKDLSVNAFAEQKKYWTEIKNSLTESDPLYKKAVANLEKMEKIETDRMKQQSTDTLTTGLKTAGTADIKQSVEWLTKYQGTLEPLSKEWEDINTLIEAGNNRLKELTDTTKYKAMTSQFSDLQHLSTNALSEQKKYWESVRDNAEQGTAAYTEAIDKLKQIQDLTDSRMKQQSTDTLTTGLKTAGTADIKQAVEWLTKYQGTLEPLSKEWRDVNAQIEAGNNRLKELTDSVKMEAMTSQFGQLNTLSKAALAEQKKYWQGIFDSAEKTSVAYKQAEQNLKAISDLEYSRTKSNAEDIISQVKAGSFKGTIAETEEAIKNVKEYQRVMKDTSPEKVKEVEDTFKSLNESLARAKSEMLSFEDAMKQANQVSEGAWDGTQEDLEKLKRSLEYFKKNKLKIDADDQKIRNVNDTLDKIEKKSKRVGYSMDDVKNVIARINTAPIEDLQKAAGFLQQEVLKANRGTVEYLKNAARLREVNKRILEVNRSLREQENVIIRTAKRLASYVLVYAGFNEVVGYIKRLTQANLELSDSLADIQKTTGLSEAVVGRLSDQINAIDTRTAQKELHDLAYEAGKLGISAEEDVLSFVKAGNQLLVALGEDLGGAEAVRQLMKVNAILGETEKLGIEKALLSTGSAINEVSQTSRASAGPIADMVSRMGAIGSAAGLSMADLIALAGTADSLGQSAEVAATAFNKFISTLTSNPVDVAFALGMDPDQIQKQLDAGNTMGVIQEIFTKMSTMGNMADLAPIMGELGSEGARMTQVLVTMAKGVGELNAQVYTSKKAFQEATSVTNEYNIKNESAAAILQRMGNNMRESVVKSGFVEWLRDVLQWLYYLPQRIEDNIVAFIMWKTVMWELVMVTGAKFVKFLTVELVGAFKSLANVIRLAALEQAALKWGSYTNKMWEAATMTTKLKYAVQALWQVITKNPFVAVAAAIGVVIAAIQTFAKETSIAVKTTAELETALQNEQTELSRLRRSIDNANSSNGERAALIKQLNEKYGKYLGFLVTETNYVDQQAYIYDLLNAKLRETVSLKMQEKMMDDIAQKHAAKRLDANKDIQSALNVAVGKINTPEVMDKIYTEITKQVENKQKDVNAVLKAGIGDLAADLQKQRADIGKKYADGIIGYDVYTKELEAVKKRQRSLYSLRDGIKDLLNVETDINKEISDAQDIITRQQKTSEKRSIETTREHLDEQFKNLKTDATTEELQTLQSQTTNYIKQQEASISGLVEKKKALQGLSYAEEKEYEELTKEIFKTTEAVEELNQTEAASVKPEDERYERWQQLHNQKQKTVKLSEEEEKKIAAANAEIKRMEKLLGPVNKKLMNMSDFNIWGTENDKKLAENSPAQLVAMWDKLEKDASRLSNASFKTIGEFQEKNGKLMATQFWKNFDTREQATQWYINQKNAIAAQLKKLGYNTSGHFIGLGSGDGKSEAEEKARAEYRAVMAALEAHFLKRKQVIQDNYLQEKITGEEMNRQIADNEEAHLLARVELRKKLLGQANTFEQEKYEELAGRNIEQTGEFLRQMGDVVTDGIAKNLEQDEVKVHEGAIKIRQAFEEELLKNDIFGKFENNFRKSLDELEVLTSDFEKNLDKAIQKVAGKYNVSGTGMSEEDTKQKVQELIALADESYKVDAEGLKKKALSQTKYNAWWTGMNKKQLEVLLQQLRGYYDNVILLREQFQKRMEREFEGEYKQTGQQAEYDKVKKQLEGEAASREQLQGYGVRPDYEANREGIIANAANEEDKLRDSIDFFKERLDDFQQGSDEYIAIQDLIAQKELSLNELLAQSQRDLTQVYMDEWTKRAEKWGSVGEMFGEYLGEQLALEQQANAARARGDEETAKKLEQQQKENQQNMIKNLLNFIVDEAALWAKEYALKMMFNALELSEEKKQAIEEVVLGGRKSMAKIATSAAEGQAEEQKKGLPGLITGAIVFAATMALQAFVKSSIANMFPEASVGTTSNRKLSTGMLTYAEGNYPVLGNDGKVYDAKYEGAGMKTGIYGGGAHFGIFSEKQPEMIVDGKTTQKLILNYPYIYDAITTIAKNGRLVNAMPTFASGDYPAGMNRIAKVEAVDVSAGANPDMERMSAALEQNTAAFARLNKLLEGGIVAHLDGLETHKTQKRNERFLKRRGID